MSNNGDAEVLEVLRRHIGQDAIIYRVIAKHGLVLLKAKAPKQACHIHDGAQLSFEPHHRPGERPCPGTLPGGEQIAHLVAYRVPNIPVSEIALDRPQSASSIAGLGAAPKLIERQPEEPARRRSLTGMTT